MNIMLNKKRRSLAINPYPEKMHLCTILIIFQNLNQMFHKLSLEIALFSVRLNMGEGCMLLAIFILIESRKILFNSSLANWKYYSSIFRSSTIKRTKHFVVPRLVEDKTDVIIIHVAWNDVTKQKMDTADTNRW